MSEYSIQFWIMVGTLTTAGATLILGVGVAIAALQLQHQRDAAASERRTRAVQKLVTMRQLLIMNIKSLDLEPGEPQKLMLASERVRSAFRFAGKEFAMATLKFDSFLLECLMAMMQSSDKAGNSADDTDALEAAKEVLASATLSVNDILEDALEKKPDFCTLTDRIERVTSESRTKIEGKL